MGPDLYYVLSESDHTHQGWFDDDPEFLGDEAERWYWVREGKQV